MKKYYLILSVLVAFLMFFAVSCSKEENPVTPPPPPDPTAGAIAGKVSLQAGVSGSVENTRVAIYASYDDWNNDRVLKFTAANSSGNYSIADLPAGTYYLDAWKDNDNSGQINRGDFYQVYGSGAYPNFTLSPVLVVVGQTRTINLTLVRL